MKNKIKNYNSNQRFI